MARSQARYLSDIEEARTDAQTFAEGHDLDDFRNDRQLRYAIERALSLSGFPLAIPRDLFAEGLGDLRKDVGAPQSPIHDIFDVSTDLLQWIHGIHIGVRMRVGANTTDRRPELSVYRRKRFHPWERGKSGHTARRLPAPGTLVFRFGVFRFYTVTFFH